MMQPFIVVLDTQIQNINVTSSKLIITSIAQKVMAKYGLDVDFMTLRIGFVDQRVFQMFMNFSSLVCRSNHFHLNLCIMQGNGVVYVFDRATFQTFLVWTWPCCVEDNIYYRSFDLSDLINHDICHK
jgi:hypothetical protein